MAMAGYPGSNTDLGNLLAPLLKAPRGDSVALDAAIDEVADSLAMNGVMIVDAFGRPASGVTDEQAVLGAIDTMIRQMLQDGSLQQAGEYRLLIDRVHRRAAQRRDERRRRGGSRPVRPGSPL